MNEEDWFTIGRMMAKGSVFESNLANACYHATPEQFAAIKHALPEVFEKYRPPGIATPGPVEARVTT